MTKLIMAIVFLICAPFLGGSIIWLTYPHIFAMFPNAHGILADSLGWWDSICISFFANVIFGKNVVNNSK